MVDETVEALRATAQHRGFKLIKSRRRKPGTGDFGKFGLEDESGKKVFGFGDDGLTATKEDIEGFLRAGAVNTWQQSARVTPDRLRAAKGAAPTGLEGGEAKTPGKIRRTRGASSGTPSGKAAPGDESIAGFRKPPRSSRANDEAAARRDAAPSSDPISKTQPNPASLKPKPELLLRPSRPSDAAALATLLRQLAGGSAGEEQVRRSMGSMRKAGGGLLVATLDEIVGCIGWAVLPTIQHGPVARITLLLVDEGHRRRGIGTRLLGACESALVKAGCELLEVMSDIDIRNSHGFFRSMDFAQASYRFTRTIVH
ncbi:MAG: GNAT family N-acetyltransferase [Pseudomonas sp.]|uniref:GNAT family N-acetyltransferase n=1 Tax=Pseudomonas sp. TaxID=306 RepID=UPI0012237F3D|nr:GNAT family N-acetyltransferase [Pseudomonas sp.]RZI76990.1 MAG: GNAT family N-acetyltransferase [Pseudomonas sp.]